MTTRILNRRLACVALLSIAAFMGASPAAANFNIGPYEYGGAGCGAPTDPMNWRVYTGNPYTLDDTGVARYIEAFVGWPQFDTGSGFGSTGYARVGGAGCAPQTSKYNKDGVRVGHHTRIFANNGPDATGRSDYSGDAHRETFQFSCAKDGVDWRVREGRASISGYDAGVHEMRFGEPGDNAFTGLHNFEPPESPTGLKVQHRPYQQYFHQCNSDPKRRLVPWNGLVFIFAFNAPPPP